MLEKKKPKELGKRRVFSAQEKGSFLVCVPIFPPPTTTTTFFGLSGDCIAIKIVRNDSIYIQIKQGEDIHTVTKSETDNQTANCNHPSALDSYIFWNCFSLSILNLLKRSLIKKKNLPFIHLPIPIYTWRRSAALCILLQENCSSKKGSLLKRKSFPVFIHKSHNRAPTHTPSRGKS